MSDCLLIMIEVETNAAVFSILLSVTKGQFHQLCSSHHPHPDIVQSIYCNRLQAHAKSQLPRIYAYAQHYMS